jgi:hypothetical protein
MSAENDKHFAEQVKRQLDRHADAVDEFTAARLGAARKRALQQHDRVPHRWLPIAGLAAAATVLAVLVLMQPAHQEDPGWELWVAQDDIDVIEELDFYAWLEATQPNG